MKKIIVLFMMLILSVILVGCNESNHIKTSQMTESLNKELDEYFKIDNESKEQEILQAIYIDNLIDNYKNSNKYLISVDNKFKSKYFCAYLDIRVKDVLDSIKIAEVDGNPSWYIWQGENRYLKKYDYAIKNNIIDINEYCMKWVEFEKKEDIAPSYENLFLICIAKSIKLNLIDYENNEKAEKVIFIEENASALWNLIEKVDGFFTLLEKEIDLTNLTTVYVFLVLNYYSFKYKNINESIYIYLNDRNQKVEYDFNDYKIINEKYFYRLDEIINYIEEQK